MLRCRQRNLGARPPGGLALLLALGLALVGSLRAQTPEPVTGTPTADSDSVGMTMKIGSHVPLDLELIDEHGKKVVLRELLDRPVILTLVYFTCPGICSPLLIELKTAVDGSTLQPGEDYRLVTVSFDARDTPPHALLRQQSILRTLRRKVEPDAWRFLTGSPENLRALSDAVGFGFRFNQETKEYVHAGSLIFLSSKGKVISYINKLNLGRGMASRSLPRELDQHVLFAKDNKELSVMQGLAKLCYAKDTTTEGQAYKVRVNRIILFVTLLVVIGFVLGFLVLGAIPSSVGVTRTTEKEDG